jgi:hypothetical protein
MRAEAVDTNPKNWSQLEVGKEKGRISQHDSSFSVNFYSLYG